jgi:hypothetical protein
MRARLAWLAVALLLVLQPPSVAAANRGPGIEWADPDAGSYSMAGPGSFEVEVECAEDPDGDDVYVDFIANGRLLETDEDLWGFSPSFTFDLLAAGTYTLQARCRDTAGAAGTPNPATWRVEVEAEPESPAARPTVIEWADPEPGRYALDGADGFDVEVECVSNDGVLVEFLVDGQVVETDEDVWGLSPSYSFLLFQGGTHTLGARCRSEAGTSAPVEWTVTVPTPSSTSDLLRQARVCTVVPDPTITSDPSGEPGRVQDILLANADVWHRTGPWTCELAKLAGPVGLAYDIDHALVSVKAQLEEWSVFDYSAWDLVADLQPAVVPAWEFFEALLPILEACARALDGLDAFHTVRTAALAFLTAPSDGQLRLLKDIAVQALPAYEAWIAAFDRTAAEVDRLTGFLLGLAEGFLAAALELDRGDWFPFRDSIRDGLAALAGIAEEWAAVVHAWADGIRALADPVRGDVLVLHAILRPPEEGEAPGPHAVALMLLFAALAVALRRRRLR